MRRKERRKREVRKGEERRGKGKGVGRRGGGEGRTRASLLRWCVLRVRHWGADDVSDTRPESRSAQPRGEGTEGN